MKIKSPLSTCRYDNCINKASKYFYVDKKIIDDVYCPLIEIVKFSSRQRPFYYCLVLRVKTLKEMNLKDNSNEIKFIYTP